MGMGGGGKPNSVKSEINVTPLVDVVLVLLIIFLVTMPVVMRTVTLEVPRSAEANEDTSVAAKQIVVHYKRDATIELNDGDKTESIQATELAKTLRPLLDAKKGEKVVFVDFDDEVEWGDVVAAMDTVRSLAADDNHNEIKVALKKRDEPGKGEGP
ncbi:MAG: biopolymer transporter ExbD [Kofleriaceae bacterium]|nr:biopolymer transporter ExbD [Myxococcales bacterium]MCB9564608.1 biopolymer transporter ExbD [Kofleriaceae bacterium]